MKVSYCPSHHYHLTREVACRCSVGGPLFVNAYFTLVYQSLIGYDQIEGAETSLKHDRTHSKLSSHALGRKLTAYTANVCSQESSELQYVSPIFTICDLELNDCPLSEKEILIIIKPVSLFNLCPWCISFFHGLVCSKMITSLLIRHVDTKWVQKNDEYNITYKTRSTISNKNLTASEHLKNFLIGLSPLRYIKPITLMMITTGVPSGTLASQSGIKRPHSQGSSRDIPGGPK